MALTGVHAGRQYDARGVPAGGVSAQPMQRRPQRRHGRGRQVPAALQRLPPVLPGVVHAQRRRRPRGRRRRVHGDGPQRPLAGWSRRSTIRRRAPATRRVAGIGTGSHMVTSSVLDPATYPQFASEEAADWVLPGGAPFDPHTGEWYMYSQNADERVQAPDPDDRPDRRHRRPGGQPLVLDLVQHRAGLRLPVRRGSRGGSGRLDHPAGRERAHHPGHGYQLHGRLGGGRLHNHLLRYQTLDPANGTCIPTGTTGEWHAGNGNSAGWQEWSIDLSRWAGKQVEIGIVFATDGGVTRRPGRARGRHHGHRRFHGGGDLVRDR